MRLRDVRLGDVILGDVRLGDVRPGDVRLGDVRLGGRGTQVSSSQWFSASMARLDMFACLFDRDNSGYRIVSTQGVLKLLKTKNIVGSYGGLSW